MVDPRNLRWLRDDGGDDSVISSGDSAGARAGVGEGVLRLMLLYSMVPKKPTRVAAPSPRASLGRRTVCGHTEQRRPPVSKRYETN